MIHTRHPFPGKKKKTVRRNYQTNTLGRNTVIYGGIREQSVKLHKEQILSNESNSALLPRQVWNIWKKQ